MRSSLAGRVGCASPKALCTCARCSGPAAHRVCFAASSRTIAETPDFGLKSNTKEDPLPWPGPFQCPGELCLDGGGFSRKLCLDQGVSVNLCAHRIRARAQLPSRSRGLRFAQGPRPYALTLVAPGPLLLRCGSAIVSLEAPRLSLGFRV